jgi:hypothetical protein
MAKARSGSAVKKGLKFFVYGKQGSKKSSFALDFVKMVNENGEPLRVFYLDTEFGSIDNYLEIIEGQGYDLSNLFIVYSNTYNEAEEWLSKAIDDEDIYYEDDEGNEVLAIDANGNPFRADVIIVDSITPIQDTVTYGMIQTSEKRARLRAQKKENTTQAEIFVAEATAGMEFKDYNKLQAKGKNLLRGLITRTNKYVCVISREKDKKESKKGSNGEVMSVKIGVMPDCPKDAEYEFFTVIHMQEDEDTGEIFGQIDQKDRTLLFQRGEIINNPSPILWQEIIDKNKGKKELGISAEKYEDIIEAEANALYGKKQKPTSNESTTTSKDVGEDTPETLIAKIKDARNSLNPAKKQALSAEFVKNNLPKVPKEELGVEVLKDMLTVAKSM